jgi:hypothetical protein
MCLIFVWDPTFLFKGNKNGTSKKAHHLTPLKNEIDGLVVKLMEVLGLPSVRLTL